MTFSTVFSRVGSDWIGHEEKHRRTGRSSNMIRFRLNLRILFFLFEGIRVTLRYAEARRGCLQAMKKETRISQIQLF